MATGTDVLKMLRPEQGWGIYGDDFDSIWYDEGVVPLTKEEFEKGFAEADEYFLNLKNQENERKEKILAKLGITEDEAKLLLS